MNRTLCLSCNTCTQESDVDARTTMVMQGEIARAVFWQCPGCQATQWTTVPRSVSDAIRRGARQAFGRVPFLASVDGVCGQPSIIPLRELFTYPTASGSFVLWHCGACERDRVSPIHPNLIYKIIGAGGTAMAASEGAMVELLALDDYQPHDAMAAAGFPFRDREDHPR